MALRLTDGRYGLFEPYKKNRWIFQFETVPGSTLTNATEELAFVCHTVKAPDITIGELTMPRLNDTFYAAGKTTFGDINASFYDFLRGEKSAGQIMYDWASSIYNQVTGQSAYKSEYATNATLAQLDPKGGVARLWNIFYVWPKAVTFGDSMAASEDAAVEVTTTLRYDYAIKGKDVTTDPNITA